MRVNGNYFERYILTLFPWILVGGGICFFFLRNITVIVITLVSGSLLFSFIDNLSFKKYKLPNLFLRDGKLYINERIIDQNEISIIRPHRNISNLYLIIELYLDDNTCIRFMDKSKLFFYKSNNELNSKSLDILFKAMPALKKKMRAQQY